jgi:abhydrolase domain-containing protein 6
MSCLSAIQSRAGLVAVLEGQRMSAGCKAIERPPLVLVNGLAEQEQTWFANDQYWQEWFLVHRPVLDVPDQYHGTAKQRLFSIEQRIERLREYIGRNIGRRVHVVANSMGGALAIELAVRHPDAVNRLVLLAPSGLARQERLPILAGTRLADSDVLVRSVFYDPERVPEHLFQHYRLRLEDRAWRRKLVQMVRATAGQGVCHLVGRVHQPTLVILGTDDRIVDPIETAMVARGLRRGRVKVLQSCGHAPQIEHADEVNRLVVRFLLAARPNGANSAHGSLNEGKLYERLLGCPKRQTS